jgi:hypothetical protein
VLRRIFYLREVIAIGWRKIHKEKLHNLYSSINTIRVIKCRRVRRAVHTARMKEISNGYYILFGKPEGKRTRSRWEDGT